VIPIYNKEKFIEQAIQSVLYQTYSHWQMLLIDDASRDHTLSKVKPYVDGKKTVCLPLKANIGLAQVLNYALTRINTPYFLHLDADDWLAPRALEVMLPRIQSNPNAALVYANHIVHWEDSYGKTEKTEQIVLEQYKDRYDFLVKLNEALTPRLYRTDCVRQIGGWLTQFAEDNYVEDVQIQLRLAGIYEWIWVDEFLHHRRKYKQNVEEFERTRPKRWLYRYHLYNQILLEWGDQYRAVWQKKGEAIYLQKLVKNPNPTPLHSQTFLP
jgi:glycosyltransferase involved in cell wall biosynthesis